MRKVLAGYGIASGRRAVTVDATEEVILLTNADFERTETGALTLALMEVLPHRKVLLVRDDSLWRSEPI